MSNPNENFLVIFGSGETAPSAVKVYTSIFQKIGKDKVTIAIITTSAGFQPNVEIVHQDIAGFFQKSLQNFHPQIKIIYANDKDTANDIEVISNIDDADYIFIGPGSPTYAAQHLKNTLLLEKIITKVQNGTNLILASAALAFSRYCLPVYEIYKVGEDLYWEKGLDVYNQLIRPLTLITHFNNNEGGSKNDTSYCFMGEKRFNKLLKLLPTDEEIWGLDEHTAVICNLEAKNLKTLGKGNLHEINNQ
ncbi:hypothetical protein A2773_01710 [Candidatus Gottesmanbacteria bacterium RIFCSPHIGHO2_01_FULL_39_10]|uniref:Cysteinyl-tRNA synthetase n=1 Tax=Candidatus Gottesmanbacteria bacterium RIFCSPHIGHO2_01_FULL_39_10 TaxID=1798375 RepID=A0A1F5ZK83_9BACT|nr:MAG: hypothetical protein A2773_01710 [Candidatus Gottesmanbacteria bacterium RIFCSPHIGHO2_01_FULL_39_10]